MRWRCMNGEALPDIVKRPTAVNTELTSGPSRQDFENRLFKDLDPAMRAWAIERCTMHPIAAMTAPVKLDRFWDQSWNASVIWCKQSTNPPVAHQRRACETAEGPLARARYRPLSDAERARGPGAADRGRVTAMATGDPVRPRRDVPGHAQCRRADALWPHLQARRRLARQGAGRADPRARAARSSTPTIICGTCRASATCSTSCWPT